MKHDTLIMIQLIQCLKIVVLIRDVNDKSYLLRRVKSSALISFWNFVPL